MKINLNKCYSLTASIRLSIDLSHEDDVPSTSASVPPASPSVPPASPSVPPASHSVPPASPSVLPVDTADIGDEISIKYSECVSIITIYNVII